MLEILGLIIGLWLIIRLNKPAEHIVEGMSNSAKFVSIRSEMLPRKAQLQNQIDLFDLEKKVASFEEAHPEATKKADL